MARTPKGQELQTKIVTVQVPSNGNSMVGSSQLKCIHRKSSLPHKISVVHSSTSRFLIRDLFLQKDPQ
jgi:hypothetical protein